MVDVRADAFCWRSECSAASENKLLIKMCFERAVTATCALIDQAQLVLPRRLDIPFSFIERVLKQMEKGLGSSLMADPVHTCPTPKKRRKRFMVRHVRMEEGRKKHLNESPNNKSRTETKRVGQRGQQGV